MGRRRDIRGQNPNDAQYAIALFDDNFILIDEKRAGIITSYHIDKNDMRTVKGYQIKAILRNRIIIPPSHTTHDRRYAEAETVMKHYVDRHAVYPSDSARLIPNLVLKQIRNVVIIFKSKAVLKFSRTAKGNFFGFWVRLGCLFR